MTIRECVAPPLGILAVTLSVLLIGSNGRVSEDVNSSISPAGADVAVIDAGARSAGVTDDWLARTATQIESEEYRASVNERGLQAPNRAHNLRTYFKSDGIEVLPRTGEPTAAWSFSWRTTGWGREGNIVDVTAATCEPRVDGARVSYIRGGMDEWYDNKKAGLEQGFIVRERPAGEGLACIEGRIGDGLRPELLPDEGAIDLMDGNGARALRYAELHVRDAAGRGLPSTMRLEGDRISILIDDAGAAYPVVVDPLVSSPSWAAESNQINAYFGFAVGTAGDVNGDGYSDAIVGAADYDNGQVDEGRVYLYHGSAHGLGFSAAWTAEGNQAGAYFGRAVGTAGDVNGDGYSDVAIGAHSYDNGQTDEGRGYVYHGSVDGLGVSPVWTAESNQAGSWFGFSMGTAGDVNGDGYSDVIVGAPYYDNAQGGDGRAYVYLGSAEGLDSIAAWYAESDQDGANLAYSLGTAGDVNGDGYSDVIVGAYSYDNGEVDEGRAYVYHGSADGLETDPAWWVESDQEDAELGFSVGTAGDVNGDGYSDVIVGAMWYDNGQLDEGRAYVYHGSAAGLALNPAWIGENDEAEARYGISVGTAGDVNGDGFADVIVGANYADNGEANEGRAFVYYGSAGGLALTPAWTGESNQEGAQFGRCVRTAGDVNGDGYSDIIVGAHSYDRGQTNEGRAFVYHGSAGGLAPDPVWSAEGNQTTALFGTSVGTAGDVNGDGYSDVVVGAPYFDGGETDEGRASVYYGSAGGLAASAAWTAESNQSAAYFAQSVGTAGDVNGDGYSDIIVGAEGYDGEFANQGRAFVYYGSAGGLVGSPSWMTESDQANTGFGRSVSTAGDVNGDGYSDVIVGAYVYTNDQDFEGRAFVYHGSAGGLSPNPVWTAESDQVYAWFGCSVATAGDVNADSYSDVIVGSLLYDDGETNEGRAFVYYGSASGLSAGPSWTAESNQADARFGCSVGTAGDVNGDGYSDVIIGANGYDSGHSNEGGAFVYYGSASGLSAGPSWIGEGNQVSAAFGVFVGTAGDINGDGYSDVIVGSSGYDKGQKEEGRAFVYYGSAVGLPVVPSWTGESNQAGALFGTSVASAGDVNGDGYCDIIIGAPRYDNGETDEGRAYVYYGNEGDGLHRVARQRRADDSAPIAPLCLSSAPSYDGLLLKTEGRTAAGRANVRLQYEVKPLGVPFDGTGLVTGPAYDTGVPGVDGSVVSLSEMVSGLAAGTQYRWRLRTVCDSPFFPSSPWFSLPYNSVTEADVRIGGYLVGIENEWHAPGIRMLGLLAPNPFGTSTQLTYTLPQQGRVRLTVYNVAGQPVAVLRNGDENAGRHVVDWDGRGSRGSRLPSGVYFVQLRFGDHKESRKVVLTR